MDLMEKSLARSLIFTFLVLGAGLSAGYMMDGARTDYVQDELRRVNLQTETFLVTQNYIEKSSQNYCSLVEEQIPQLARRNTRIGQDLQAFSSKSLAKDREYKFLRQKYYVNQLRLYNILSEYRSRCDTNTTLIMYFFDEDLASRRQGAVLTDYWKEHENGTYIFSYNLETENSRVVDVLRNDWSVEDGPVVVINGNRTFRQFVSLKELRKVVEESKRST